MSIRSSRKRAVLLFVCLPLAVLVSTAGTGCPVGFTFPGGGGGVIRNPPVVIEEPPGDIIVPVDFFGLDLVNETVFSVDPGIFVDEFVLDLGLLAPLEGTDIPIAFDVDCFPGDTLTLDPVLFLPDADVLAANGPLVLEEGFDYFCGDILTIFFSQDVTGAFFVDVAVNGVPLTF